MRKKIIYELFACFVPTKFLIVPQRMQKEVPKIQADDNVCHTCSGILLYFNKNQLCLG